MLMAWSSICWLAISLLVGAIAIAKIHYPPLLAGIPALTYGRLVAVQDSVFIYGFASQAAMAVALWLICRLGATTLIGSGVAVLGALIWNLGVAVGFVGILSGNLSPFEHFQFPHAAMPILLLGYCVYGVSAILTFWSRKECSMYPSLWFVFAGLIFFPWILATAMMTLWSPVVRGSVAPIVALWAGQNLVALWLGMIGLATIYYFLPKLTGRSLYSNALAVFAFWFTILFAQSSGMHAQAAFPAWIAGLSEITTILLVIPAAASALNWYRTLGNVDRTLGSAPAYRFMRKASNFYVLSVVVAAFAALRPVNRMLEFTIFQTGLAQLTLLGFFTFSMFGAFVYILPRVTQAEWPKPEFSIHLQGSTIGAALVIGGLILGGLVQGSQFQSLTTDFVKAVRSAAIPFGGIALFGYLILFAAQIAFLFNMLGLVCCSICGKEDVRR